MGRVTYAPAATGALCGSPYEATKRVRGVPKWVAGTHAGCATWTFSGAPMGSHETCEGCAEICGWDACGMRHWDLR